MFAKWLKKVYNVGKTIANPIATAVMSVPLKIAHHIVDTANSLDEMPDNVKRVMQTFGSRKIDYIVVFREPVAEAVKFGAKILTGGKLHTPIRHVFEVFVLEPSSPSTKISTYVRMDKNEVVVAEEISDVEYGKLLAQKEHMRVDLFQDSAPSHPTLQTYFDTYSSKVAQKTIWLYDPITANCQIFVYYGLEANGAGSKIAEDWIVQKSVRSEVTGLSKDIMKGITTGANFMKRLVLKAAGDAYEDVPLPDVTLCEDDRITKILNDHALLSLLFQNLIEDMAVAENE